MSVQGEGIALGGIPTPVSTLNVTENGTYAPSAGAAYNVVNVNVEQPFSFVVQGSGSFTTSGDINVNFGDTSSDYSGNNQTVNFSYSDEKAHRIVVTGTLKKILFTRCVGLLSVDVPFPKSMAQVGSFSTCFASCTSLANIPSGLFDNCVLAGVFTLCFADCSSLSAIPDGLFDRVDHSYDNMHSCFYGCAALKTIPEGLFDGMDITDCYRCFEDCTSLTGPAPELWDETKWPNITSYSGCFASCTGLSNYADIPSDWK